MNSLLRSFLIAMAEAAINWLISMDDANVVIGWLRAKIDELEADRAADAD